MKTNILKSLIVIFLLSFSYTLNAQVSATGHIFAEIVDDVTSISVSSQNTIVNVNSTNTIIPTVFTINDTKNISFYIQTENNNSVSWNNTTQKVNINTTIPTNSIQTGVYSDKLNVNFIYN